MPRPRPKRSRGAATRPTKVTSPTPEVPLVLVLLVLRLCLFNLGTNHCFPKGEQEAAKLSRVMIKTEEMEIKY